jgi:hypothetical protein
MTPSAPAASTPPAPDRWDRSRLVPTRRQLAVTVSLAVVGALALNPVTLNPFIEVLAEAFFVSMVLLFGFKVAGAWRQTLLPRWVAQLLAVALGAAISPLIVQMLSVGGDFSAFMASRPMRRRMIWCLPLGLRTQTPLAVIRPGNPQSRRLVPAPLTWPAPGRHCLKLE